jgi:hypothetical protein
MMSKYMTRRTGDIYDMSISEGTKLSKPDRLKR